MSPLRAVPAARTFARAFSSSAVTKQDVARLTLVGRLGNDPQAKQSSNGKEYYLLSVATQAPSTKDGDKWIDGPTSWHNVFSFNEYQHNLLKGLAKGSTVYIEADLEMRPTDPTDDGQRQPDRVLLRSTSIKSIVRKKPEGQTTESE